MSYNILFTPESEKEVKRLAKKYASFGKDLKHLIDQLKSDPQQGTALGKGCFKIRLAISSKQRGKSGGARVITCVRVIQETVYVLSVYDKSETSAISDKELTIRLASLSDPAPPVEK